MIWFFLFVFGIVIGSFLNVVALRYDGERFLLNPEVIGGRSHCPHCKKTLRWFELIPVFSFLAQGGKCRHCHTRIGFQYPLVELISGIIFVAIPLHFAALGFFGSQLILFNTIWIFAFEMFLLLAYIDIRLGIIPDELNIALVILGLIEVAVVASKFGGVNASFFGSYSALFGLQGNAWINHIVAALFGAAFFGALVAVTRGRGMGMGDVKLAFPLGLLFGWPDILVIAMIAFIIGGIFGIFAITVGKKTMKSAVPFGPFLVVATMIAFFWGPMLFQGYFHMLGL